MSHWLSHYAWQPSRTGAASEWLPSARVRVWGDRLYSGFPLSAQQRRNWKEPPFASKSQRARYPLIGCLVILFLCFVIIVVFVYKPEVTIAVVTKSVAGSTDRPFYSSKGPSNSEQAKAEARQLINTTSTSEDNGKMPSD